MVTERSKMGFQMISPSKMVKILPTALRGKPTEMVIHIRNE
jgi:hypothetical protein